MHARAFVAAVLGPHDGKNAELGQRRLPLQRLDDALVLVGVEAVAGERGLVVLTHAEALPAPVSVPWVSAAMTDSNITRPSALPSDSSQARSGCGIKPTTFRCSLQIPAIDSNAPFGFASSVTAPC